MGGGDVGVSRSRLASASPRDASRRVSPIISTRLPTSSSLPAYRQLQPVPVTSLKMEEWLGLRNSLDVEIQAYITSLVSAVCFPSN